MNDRQLDSYGNNRYEDGVMSNGGEPTATSKKRGDLWICKGGTDSDGYEKEKDGMVRAR